MPPIIISYQFAGWLYKASADVGMHLKQVVPLATEEETCTEEVRMKILYNIFVMSREPGHGKRYGLSFSCTICS